MKRNEEKRKKKKIVKRREKIYVVLLEDVDACVGLTHRTVASAPYVPVQRSFQWFATQARRSLFTTRSAGAVRPADVVVKR
jgi:hypothetical protein